MPDVRLVTVTLNPAIDRVMEVEQFSVGKMSTARLVGWYPGGKGINVARVLARLGTRCIATGFLGGADLSMFEEHIERVGQGRAIMQLLVVRGQTRTNMTITDPVLDTETHIREDGFRVYPEDVRRMASKVGMLAREDSVMVFAGSLPPGVSLGDLRSMLHVCVDEGARVAVDMNESVMAALREEPLWMVKLNARELAGFAGMATGSEAEIVRAARAVSTQGRGFAEIVIATRGADGAVLIAPGVAISAKVLVHPARIVNTLGCGDSLLAGVLHEWRRSENWHEALKMGVATATATAVSREVGSLSLEDVKEFLEATLIQGL
jgi:1-phosphofructokinase family hexose kinase